MNAFFDAVCPRCRLRFGWQGEIGDRPDCRRCGYRPAQATLDAAQVEMDRFRELLRTRDVVKIREQRVAAGLTLRTAAKLLGVFPTDLSNWETGEEPLPEPHKETMVKIYGLNPTEEVKS